MIMSQDDDGVYRNERPRLERHVFKFWKSFYGDQSHESVERKRVSSAHKTKK